MNKNWFLASAIAGMVGTAFVASQHKLIWTIVGVISVGMNIYNYLHADDKTGE